MRFGTTNDDKDLIDRAGCANVYVVLPGKGRIVADLQNYVKYSTLIGDGINEWIHQKGLERSKGAPNPSLPFGFYIKNNEHVFEYIGVQLPDVNE